MLKKKSYPQSFQQVGDKKN